MAAARTRALRALLARCSTKCHRRASPSSSSAAPFSTLRGAAPSLASRCRRRLLPAPHAAAAARAQTRSLASGARAGPGAVDEDEDVEQESAVEWVESEDEGYEPEIGDGGSGGGVVLRGLKWAERALAAAEEVLADHFGDDVAMFAFKVAPEGYVYVRIDKLTARYGCCLEDVEKFSRLYRQKLDEMIESGEIPLDLGIEVSSPSAYRLLKVPEDLDRFKDMAMVVQYHAEGDNDLVPKQNLLNEGIFLLESVDVQAEHCVWKLANVKENRAKNGKGRPLNRKQKDWRLQTPFKQVKKVALYLD